MPHNVSLLPPEVKHTSTVPRVSYSAVETSGDRIRRLREAKGWTQADLADRLKLRLKGSDVTVSREAISQWERGETKNIKSVTFYWLVHELGTTYEYLLFGPDFRATTPPAGRSGRRGSLS